MVSGGGSSGNLNDLFDGLFGANAGRGGTTRQAGPQRGRDEQAEVSLSFEDAVRGVTLPLRLTGPATCSTCRGSGARPGTTPHACPTCRGTGNVSVNQGGFSFSQPCTDCRGTGRIIDDPCPECRGSGISTSTRTLTVRIPSGVRDGGKIRLSGKGGPGRNGAPAGDLYVTVHVGTHRLFGRTGDDLTITVPITFTEAALGTTLRVPTIDGSVSLKVAAGTPSGRTLRVRGRGVTTAKRSGDLLVTVQVAVPSSLSDDARSALEAYAATQPDDPRPEITAALGAVHATRAESGETDG
jgi:molecular chaperone DnaJ